MVHLLALVSDTAASVNAGMTAGVLLAVNDNLSLHNAPLPDEFCISIKVQQSCFGAASELLLWRWTRFSRASAYQPVQACQSCAESGSAPR